MCGITGFIDFNNRSSADVLKSMADTIIHRGPDDSGYEFFPNTDYQVGLGFRRLSIIELSELGHQPMFSPDKNLCIIFNGEIYNYKEIRKELENGGIGFRSNSDTEVILQSYIKWGKDCVKKFIGMFAIAIYDKPNQTVTLFRDRTGVKPLFFYQNKGLVLFGSELKTFHKHPLFEKKIDFNAVSLFFSHGYISAPYTIFENTFKLIPGHLLELNLKTQKASIEKYWDVYDYYNKPRLNISYNEAIEETEKVLASACKYRMIADVPVGVFLSGGYDSSAVTALLQKNSTQKIKTFTIGFHEQNYNEAEYAKDVAKHLGTEHTEYYCTFKEAIDIVPQLPEIYDEPFGDSSAIPTTLVSKIARQHVTVALSADGGDEIFAGYPKYIKGVKYYSLLDKIPQPLTYLAGQIMRLTKPEKRSNYSIPDRYEKLIQVLLKREPVYAFNIVTEVFTYPETLKILLPNVKYLNTPFDENRLLNNNNDFLSRFQAVEYKTYLVDDILQKVDRATMSVSLEGREPFLDQRIVEWVAQLPSSFKLKNNTGKIILRDIVHKYIPEKMMNRPKMGFGVPIAMWCKNELKDLLLHYLDTNKIRSQGIFNPAETDKMVKSYFASNKNGDFNRMWFLLMFQMWYERWME
jgi:asparagine synthase (glutamine-hydrolysing)